jgi:hypothetical protein
MDDRANWLLCDRRKTGSLWSASGAGELWRLMAALRALTERGICALNEPALLSFV